MKILVAVDSFKGSLGSREAGEIIKAAILEELTGAEVIVKPLADGGEGTVEALTEGLGGDFIDLDVKGPLGGKVRATYGVVEDMAIMEMAQASGLTLVDKRERNPLKTTSYGLGDMIVDALDRGYRNFIIGIGGSATNDLGLGMLTRLGFKFLDQAGERVGICGRDLENIADIDDREVDGRLKECKFQVACDVDNPLFGPRGAARIYGPQKGASLDEIDRLDTWAEKFSSLVEKKYGLAYEKMPGAGAAGGLGYAFKTFLEGELTSGIDIVTEFLGLEEAIRNCDLAITGEGELDYQTMMGKAPSGVAKLAKKYGLPVIALAGSLGRDVEKINDQGVDAYFSITPRPMSLEEAMDRELASFNLRTSVRQIMRLYSLKI